MPAFHPLRKVLFLHLHSISLGAVMAASVFMQHRLLTASVSHGGPFFVLLPSCVLRSILCFFQTQKSRFLSPGYAQWACIDRAIDHFLELLYLRDAGFVAFRLPPSVGFESEGFLCILYGVGLTTTCPLGSVETDLFPAGFFFFLA